MAPVFVHIGLHKTGTTYLQEAVFPRVEGMTVVRGIAPLRTLLTPAPAPILISDESISGIPFDGRWREQFDQSCDHLRTLFGDPAIVIGFRRHEGMILSLYKQYLHQGHTGDLESLFSFEPSRGVLGPDDLRYRPRLERLRSTFSRVFVYTQEQLQKDPASVLGPWFEFMGVDAPVPESDQRKARVNVGLRGEFQARWLRRFNRVNRAMKSTGWLPGLDNGLMRRLGIAPRDLFQRRLAWVKSPKLDLPADMKQRVADEFQDDWQYVLEHQGELGAGLR